VKKPIYDSEWEGALAFMKIKAASSQSARLGYLRDDRIQCVFTDANVFNILGMVTHIPIEDAEKLVELLRHEPLDLAEHRFNAMESELVSCGKEAFAIKDTMQIRMLLHEETV